jgi:hypothetical protein
MCQLLISFGQTPFTNSEKNERLASASWLSHSVPADRAFPLHWARYSGQHCAALIDALAAYSASVTVCRTGRGEARAAYRPTLDPAPAGHNS